MQQKPAVLLSIEVEHLNTAAKVGVNESADTQDISITAMHGHSCPPARYWPLLWTTAHGVEAVRLVGKQVPGSTESTVEDTPVLVRATGQYATVLVL